LPKRFWRKFLLAFQADARAFGKAEHVFGFDVAIDDRIVLRARRRPGNKSVLARDVRDKFTTKNFRADVNLFSQTLEIL
jgi:hypothetical protein